MTTILAFLGLVFLIMIISSVVQGYNAKMKERGINPVRQTAMNTIRTTPDEQTPFYLPVSKIRTDGIYMLKEKDFNGVWMLYFFKSGEISWFGDFVNIETNADAIFFLKETIEAIKNPRTHANYTKRENNSIIPTFDKCGESQTLNLKLKKN